MKLQEKDILKIKTLFKDLNSKQELVELINYVNKLIYGENSKTIKLKQLTYYTNPKFSKTRYTSFSIPKKSGEQRIIHAPVNSLKHILKPLNIILNTIATPHFKATGFVPGKSILDNAKQHIGKHYVYNIDLKNFFHSFGIQRVKYGFMVSPFNLGKEKEELAYLLASLCTHPFDIEGSIKTVLPQGAPTSPTITNILCIKLDKRLNGLAKRFNIAYSRYADDITFSSQTNIFKSKEFKNELKRIIVDDQKLIINEKKIRLQKSGFKQEVTGLTVNNKVNVNKRYIKQLRMYLHFWEKYGEKKAEQIFRKDYSANRGYTKKESPNFRNVIQGKLLFLKMVKGQQDSTYLKLQTRFNKLNENKKLNNILHIWENQSIDNAMSAFEKYKNKTIRTDRNNYKVILSL